MSMKDNVVQFKPKDHTCSCGGNCGHEHPEGEPHICKCHVDKAPAANRVRIQLEGRSADQCVYILRVDGESVVQINVEKQVDSIRVTMSCGYDVPVEVKAKFEAEVCVYESINAQQYVEFYSEGEDLIPEALARTFSSVLRSGVLTKVDPDVLSDGWEQRQLEFEDAYYSVVTHPEFDASKEFGCSCVDESGFFAMGGFAE